MNQINRKAEKDYRELLTNINILYKSRGKHIDVFNYLRKCEQRVPTLKGEWMIMNQNLLLD